MSEFSSFTQKSSEEKEVEDYVGLFTSFLKNFKDRNGDFKYKERIKEMISREGKSVIVGYEDLISYDAHSIELIENNPVESLEAFGNAVKEIASEVDLEYARKVPKFFVRFNGWSRTLSIRKISSEHINKLVMVEGIIVKATPVRNKLYKAKYVHVLPTGEEHEFEWPPFEEELREELEKPPYCPTCINTLTEDELIRRRFRGVIKLKPDKSKFRDWQLVVVQERPEEIPAGQIPRSVEVVLTEDIVDIARPGDRVAVIGIVRLQKSGREDKTVFTPYIEANNVIVAQRVLEELKLSPEDEELILELSKDPLIRRKIIASVAPTIYGLWDVKEAIALALFGGVTKTSPDGTRMRGDIHILLVGDPGTAKSQLLQYAARIAPRGIYTSGKGSSAAGLTATVVKDKQTGEYFLEAGAMVLADGGVVAIDEIDKMRDEDRVAIHEAMEQGTVSIAKAGIVARLNARASVIAAGNPKRGRYIATESPAENINLPVTILSRFDLLYIVRDVPELGKDTSLTSFVLKTHEKAGYVEPDIKPDLLRKYIAYARKHVKPVLTEEAERIIKEYYIELRKRSSEREDAPLAITARQLEALVRLAEAHARMRLKPRVEAEDAVEAVRLMNAVLEQVGLDVETGNIDIDTLMAGKPKSIRDKEVAIIKTIREVAQAGEECIKFKELKRRAEEIGIDEETLDKILRNLRRSGEIYERRTGCYALS